MYTKNIMLFPLFLVINSALILGMDKKDSTSISNTQEPLEVFLRKRLPTGITPNKNSLPTITTKEGMTALLKSVFSENNETVFSRSPIDFIEEYHQCNAQYPEKTNHYQALSDSNTNT